MASKKKLCFEIVLDGLEGLQVREYTAEKVSIKVKECVWARLDHKMEGAASLEGSPQEEDAREMQEILKGPLEDMAVTVQVKEEQTETYEDGMIRDGVGRIRGRGSTCADENVKS